MTEKTKPRPLKPEGVIIDTKDLAAGRYGTYEMAQVWGPEVTMGLQLRVLGKSSLTLSRLHPDIVSPECAEEICSKADLYNVDPDRIREIEEKTGHDIIAVSRGLEEQLSEEAKPHVGKLRTSGDTTQTARALQIRRSLEVIAGSIENLRDIVIEKSVEWRDDPYMDTTHLIDALPTVAGRPFAHYAEMLQSGLGFLRFVYDNSIMGKWGDATGNHHSATSVGIDGMQLEAAYCHDLGVGRMIAPAQIPGLEFEADIFYVMARLGETINNIAGYIASGKGSDVDVFIDANPKRRKGSFAMPHKDARGGNPIVEEQDMSVRRHLIGNLMTAMMNCEMPYARNLAASANSRINFEDGFKFLDHGIRRLAGVVYHLDLDRARSLGRVNRTYGIVTANRVLTHLTDPRKVGEPMGRNAAHDLLGRLATQAYTNERSFAEVLAEDGEVNSRLRRDQIDELADPVGYVGQSKEIIDAVAKEYHGKRTLGVA